MVAAFRTWTVLSHGPIRAHAENLWSVEGSLPDMPLRRVMTLVRLGDGSLVVHNPIALNDAAMTEIESFGAPAYLLIPNGWHRLDARVVADRYPAAKVLCPFGATRRVEKVVRVDGAYTSFPNTRQVSLHELDGVNRGEGYVRVESRDGVTLVFNDAVFNQPHLPGLFGVVYRLLGSTGGPRVTPLVRLFLVHDAEALRVHLLELAEEPKLARVIVMHGTLVTERAGDFLRHVADTLE